ncbi:acetyl-CoA carboxylase biotin carboxyl carrier protein [Clostridium brassicae]|uniref:Biotin carboxyl carrier protein of acetyl-CoA carboxylase n=1 Tax=Clostridium brassicae TaxID=2999072 RepID=A0ABT4D9T6_9CLOT|nr:acetyl-CoA carboxylase biotin carboxyl carrier protein [Clostridium brassicae]MCY6959072.1 acetyl-CoA carboxylase biotin carboxyl carrier protein [Clostridium brassicae]
MDTREICEIIKEISNSNLTFAEIKSKDMYIKLEKGGNNSSNRTINELDNSSKMEEISEIQHSKESAKEINKETANSVEEKKAFETINSPLVGTFYISPAPDKEAYVSVGSKVKKGDTVCIVEAMKLMNEIESPYDGEIVEVFIENEAMVEYNQPLFKIKVK